MTLRDQIAAAERWGKAGKLTATSARQLATIKNAAHEAHLADLAEREFDLTAAHRARILDVREPYQGAGNPLSFRLEIRDGQGKRVYADDVHVQNPPIDVEVSRVPNPAFDPDDPKSEPHIVQYREDPRAAFREVIAKIAAMKIGIGR